MQTEAIQTISSRKTSVRKIPNPYTNLEFKPCSTIYDYGCGAYFDDVITYMKKKDKSILLLGWDKYNHDNKAAYTIMHKYTPEYIICSCVINVIKEDNVINGVLKDIYDIAGKDTEIIFNIYEGNKSGVGKRTSCGYQRNMKTKDYLILLCEWFDIIQIKNETIIICRKVM